MRILVVEDDVRLAGDIRKGLTEEGYAVDTSLDGPEGQALAETIPYDLIVLDILLPGKDGISICRDLRDKRTTSRILMLTCRDTVNDRVQGLDAGADDYLIKPFEFPEFYARVRALIRRGVGAGSPVMEIADLTLNTNTKDVRRGGKVIQLTRTEYSILHYLMFNRGTVISKTMMENHVWNTSSEIGSNIVEVHVGRLREKLGDKGKDPLIQTVRGFGYVIRPE